MSATPDPEESTSKTDDRDRWAVRKVDLADRQAAVAAAQRAGLSVGEWLGRAIRAAVAAEREPLPGEVMVQHEQLPALAGQSAPLSIEQVGHAVSIVCKLSEAAQKPPPRRFVSKVNQILLARITDAGA